ncbi:DUF192 domain-containing protein [Candidatus Woesearchaeota archaeon]|nr:DUF192 domain-containing protein [Candidatus Woesearchaeota archaeon]
MKLKNYKIYKNPILQFIGLRFSRKTNKIIVFELFNESKINSIIDTFFVFYAINVIWLDKNKKVVDIRNNVKPFSFAIPKKRSKYVIESTNFLNIKIGEKIKF